MTRIILKPAGGVAILAALVVLSLLAFRRNTSARVAVAPSLSADAPSTAVRGGGETLLQVNTDTWRSFRIAMRGADGDRSGTEPPSGWGANLWDEQSSGEVYLASAAESNGREKSVCLRTLTGKPSAQLFYTGEARVEAGTGYVLTLKYRTVGWAHGTAYFMEHAPAGGTPLPDTGGAWRDLRIVRVSQDNKLTLCFQTNSVGRNTGIYLKDISVSRD